MVKHGDVVVVAPDRAQSGMGHAVTINGILKMEQVTFGVEGVQAAWQTTGTPVDCVKLAIYEILGKKPDLLLSGINHGSNASINVIYSGTMSAAVEGAVEGILPSDLACSIMRPLLIFRRACPSLKNSPQQSSSDHCPRAPA